MTQGHSSKATDVGDAISPARPPQPHAMQVAATLGEESSAQPLIRTATPVPQQRGPQAEPEATGTGCHITLQVSFFFDGTGNNRHADEPTHQGSNVDRLFRAHPLDDQKAGIYGIYIPGIGTYFPEIGDPGETALGLATGKYGEPRLTWAMQQLDKIVATHPPAKLKQLRIAVFGFSRGSALARAFAIRIAKRFQRSGAGWRWDTPNIPVRFTFLGVFETVAAVGVAPLGDLGELRNAYELAKGNRSIDKALGERRMDQTCGIEALAFGKPGADPTLSPVDGHMSWADDLRVPRQVEHCVSMIAAHEQRNSFALDSVRQRDRYPDNCVEMMFPGMHSDVGGGYRPGAQGRSFGTSEILAQLPLLSMHKMAIERGVPLRGLSEIQDRRVLEDFQVSDKLVRRWNHYMDTAGRGGKPLGEMLLAHTRLWYQWRFQRIHAFLNKNGTWKHGDTMPNEDAIFAKDNTFAREHAKWQKRVDTLKNDPARKQAQATYDRAQSALESARARQMRFGGPITSELQAYQQAEKTLEQANDPYYRAKGRLAAVPGSDAEYLLHAYDIQLMKDMAVLRSVVKQHEAYMHNRDGMPELPPDQRGAPWLPSKQERLREGLDKLRPHYQMLMDTYEAEFVHDSGLRDKEIIAFFNDYVHESLAGFHKDLTLPTDPRCIYVGGDREIKYANATELPGQADRDIASTQTAKKETVEA